jgi:all-trans-retinol 13,14-reductase
MRRGADSDDFKTGLAELALDQAERTWPGFRQAVRDREASTPLTIESYTGHLGGAAYGVAPVLGRHSERALRCLSEVPGLVLAGQDMAAAGVIGTFYGGLAAASAIHRRDAAPLVLRGGRAVGKQVGFPGGPR